MKPPALRRLLGLATGSVLIAVGSAEIAITRPATSHPRLCEQGFCPDQFSPERVFEIGQKAALGDPHGEVEDFKRAVQLSPASAYRWADLGEAEVNVRDYARAHYALGQALKAGPHSPVILVRAANAEFLMGDMAGVLKHSHQILSDPGSSDYYDSAFLSLSRADIPIATLLTEGVPRMKEPLAKLLVFWTRLRRTDEAVSTWKWAHQQGLTEPASAGLFFRFLVASGSPEVAQQIWREYAAYPLNNAVFNPGFESPFQPSPFDWTIDERQDVEVVRTQEAAHAGSWSLRMRFNGDSNTAYRQTRQDMVLAPGRYRFSAMVKTDQVTTDEGIRFHIVDVESPAKLDQWTSTLIGSNAWTKLEQTFLVQPGTKLVRIEPVRNTSLKFDNKFGGTTWIDDVEISR